MLDIGDCLVFSLNIMGDIMISLEIFGVNIEDNLVYCVVSML